MSSLVSAVLAGLLDVWLLSDSELSEGDSRAALRTWLCCACGACSACVCGRAGDTAGDTAGDRFLPLPSTRPPPRDLREAMVECMGSGSRAARWAALGVTGER